MLNSLRVRFLISVIFISFASLYANNNVTQIFDSNFKSLQVEVEGNEFFPPIITLNGDDRVIISFDELAEDMQYLRYRVVHCNADWKPSSLVESEYIDGFNMGNINDYSFSSGTFVHYVHYEITLPNEDMRLTKSGNYLLQVYPENDPDNILLQARFYVSEQAVSVGGEVTSRTDVDYNDKSQQVSVRVDTRTYQVQNMYNDLRVVVTQNSRPDNEVVLVNPLQAGRNYALYSHNKNLIFPASNEYRRFEVVATEYPGMNVESVRYHHPYYHANLFVDQPRNDQPYSYDHTINGRYKIRQSSVNNSDTDADYVVVHFALDIPKQYGGKIYLNGDFTQGRFSSENEMRYNPESELYEADMLLKMGAYNYQYLWVPDGENVGRSNVIEGDKYQTVNEYVMKVYHRPMGERYDRLIGFSVVYSGR